MRKILFRAYSKKYKEYISKGFCVLGETTCFNLIEQWYIEIKGIKNGLLELMLNDVLIEQFTGLTDKNGNDIYEGDILLHTGTNQSDLEVHFKDGAFFGKGIFTDCIMDRYLKSYDFQSLEIIGNIHDKTKDNA